MDEAVQRCRRQARRELVGQCETTERITTAKATYHVEHHAQQKYRCSCNGALATASPRRR